MSTTTSLSRPVGFAAITTIAASVPLVAVVAWAEPLRPIDEVDALGRPRTSARAGLAFDYPNPEATFAMFEMLATLAFD